MINLEEIAKLRLAKSGDGLALMSDKRRIVRLELNCQGPTQLALQTGTDKLQFLANVSGRETLVFIADGNVVIWPDSEHEIWWWTAEMEQTAEVVHDAEIFTKIANRRVRNPELERIAQKMQENTDRRMAAMFNEMEALRRQNAAAAAPKPEEKKRGSKRKDAGAEAPSEASGDEQSVEGNEEGEANDADGAPAKD